MTVEIRQEFRNDIIITADDGYYSSQVKAEEMGPICSSHGRCGEYIIPQNFSLRT
jgi:hypothetical protein